MYTGNYFDGKTSKPHTADIFIKSDGLSINITDTGQSLTWKFSEIAKFQKQNNGTTFYYGIELPHSSLIVEDPNFLETLERTAAEAAFLKNIHRKFEKKGKWSYIGALIAVAAFLLLTNMVILPTLADAAAKNVPLNIEKEWGDEFFITFKQFNTIDSSGTEILNDFAAQLNFQSEYDLRFYVVESEIVNAFALPGGRIVLFTGIIDKMESCDELVALLGHEVGHVVNRHSLKNIFNQYSHSYILKLLLGNGSDILSSIGQSASQLSLLANSRAAETEADKFGLAVLNSNQVNPEGMVQLFSTLAEEHDNETLEVLEIVSTHPNMKKRIIKIKQLIKNNKSEYSEHKRLTVSFEKLKHPENFIDLPSPKEQ